MEFEDHEAFERWLKEQPKEVCVAIATRAALRVWPLTAGFRFWKDTAEARSAQEIRVLLTGWSILISGVASIFPTPEIRAAVDADGVARTVYAAFATVDFDPAAYGAYIADAARASADAADAAIAVAAADAAYTAKAARAASHAIRASAYAHDTDFAAVAARAAAYADAGIAPEAMLATGLWHDAGWPKGLTPKEIGPTLLDTDPRFDFFKRWYDGMVRGAPLEWKLQRRVALIPPETWQAGADAVAEAIAKIEAAWEAEQAEVASSAPVTEKELSVVIQRVTANRDALAVSSASLLEQLDAFRERVRGMNAIDPELRDEILAFIDGFRRQLDEMLHELPPPGEEVGEERGNRLVRWLRGYHAVIVTKLAHYSSPENVGEATVPTAIILGATGVGAMMGQPLAGAAVGGLIANQMKPGQAAKELVKPQNGDDGSAG